MARFQTARSATYHCSFCGKNQDQVERLIAGPGRVFICDECVSCCQGIIEEGRAPRHAATNAPDQAAVEQVPDEHQLPAPLPGRCPECRAERAVAQGMSTMQLTTTNISLDSTTELWALVCPQCGYTTFYAKDPNKLTK